MSAPALRQQLRTIASSQGRRRRRETRRKRDRRAASLPARCPRRRRASARASVQDCRPHRDAAGLAPRSVGAVYPCASIDRADTPLIPGSRKIFVSGAPLGYCRWHETRRQEGRHRGLQRTQGRARHLCRALHGHGSGLGRRGPELSAIWNRVSFALRQGGQKPASLQAAWREHGPDSFIFEPVEALTDEQLVFGRDRMLKERRAHWCEALRRPPSSERQRAQRNSARRADARLLGAGSSPAMVR